MTVDEKYMSRCIQLARNGCCNTPPNPMVGAVIVHNGMIVGEGYHVRCGEGHAEVNAIRSVKNEELLKESTIYVSLEPCSHYGKTPPCADLIIKKGIPRVVVGCMDPFPLVAGRGIQKLRDAGVDVTVGVLEEACRRLIKRFIVFNTQHRPYITLKWAQSADGFIDVSRQSGSAEVLSTPVSSVFVHKQRAENQAILIGTRTAWLDNPSLTTRLWAGANPLRLVIDKDLSLSSALNLFDGKTLTWVFTARKQEDKPNVMYKCLDFEQDILPQIMEHLYDQKKQSLIVEGGSCLLQSFLEEDLWDEIDIEYSVKKIGGGVPAPTIPKGYVSEFKFRGETLVSHYEHP